MTGDLKLGGVGRVEPEEDRDYPAHLRMKDVFGYHSMTFLHRVPAAVLVLENGKIIFANTAVKRLFGWGSRDLRKKTLDLIAAGNDHGNRFRQLAEKAGGGTGPVQEQIACVCRDGRNIVCEVSFQTFSDQGNEYTLAVFHDITEHVRTQEALKKNDEKYSNLLETIGAAYFELDPSGRFTFFNGALCKGLGYREEEVRSMNFRDFMDGETAEKLRTLFLDLYSTGKLPLIFETEVIRKDGEKIAVEVWVSLLKSEAGRPIGAQGIARDVTDRRKARIALEESEEKYRLHFNAVSDVIFTMAPDYRVLSISPSVEIALGYTPDEIVGKTFIDLNIVAPEYLQEMMDNGQKIFSGEATHGSIYEFIAKDGTRKFGEISASPIIRDGKVVASLGVARNVTERILAEKAMIESEKKFRDVFDNVSDYLYFHDFEGYLDLDQTNRAGLMRWGYAKDDKGRINIKDLMVPEYRHEFDAYIRRVLEKGWDEGYISVRDDRKRTRVLEYRNSLVMEGKKAIGVRGSARDITERIRAETRLKKSEEKYRTILEEIEDGYYEVDLAGNFRFFNDAMCRLIGYTREEMIGMNNRMFTDEECGKDIYRVFNRVFRTGTHDKGYRWDLIRKDGSKVHVETSITLIRDAEGKPKGFRGICRDITQRVQAEEERKKLESKLQQARKMEAIGTLAGGVAHDLNNILSGLVSYPELMLLDLAEDDPLRKPIATIQRSGEKAAAIVQDLLTLARRGVPTREAVSIASILSDYGKSPEIKKLRSRYPQVEISVSFDDDLLPVMGSPAHLSKTISNLIANAAESIQGRGVITVTARNTYLDTPVKGYDSVIEGEYVSVCVADTGPGMPAEDLERIFEPFYTRKVLGRSGTGLEMTVVLGTVQDHQGYIASESSEGEGTTFTFYLPATRAEVQEREPQDIQDYLGRGEHVVVVDDVDVQRDIATQILMRLGYSVQSFASGEEAVEYLKDHSADLVILDMIMDPGIDGLETYRRILQYHPGQKAIIASGYSETQRVRELQILGAGSYIKKPYLIEKLGIAVRTELDR
ncbi:MAG: PAS domain S-box protein [Desulfomonilia bacterium]|jgi:PAS domain S-box-containing protein